MTVFKIFCKDSITGMEMIATDCSFNAACDYLEHQNLGKYLGCDSFGNISKIKFDKRDFFYDEERGYLLGAMYY